jgi:nitrile hydratase
MTDTKREAPASPEKRAAALEIVLRRKADMPKNFVAEFTEHADDAWITANGAQMVARAWTDPPISKRGGWPQPKMRTARPGRPRRSLTPLQKLG